MKVEDYVRTKRGQIHKITDLKDMVFYLQEKLEEKDKEIESLKEELKEYRKPIMQYYKKVTSIGDKNDR